MESQNTFISSSTNLGSQIQSGKNPLPSLPVSIFEYMSSKTDLYDQLEQNLQYYMPPYEQFTKDFAKLVFKGEKQLMKNRDVRRVVVTRYDELSVKNLYENFMKLEGVKKFFPDTYPKGRVCDREYLFNIVNTLHEEVVQDLIQYALQQRHILNEDFKKKESVLITDHWKEELKSLPLKNTKKGRMVQLLKQKSKIIVAQKPRKTYEVKNMFKKPKVDPSVTQSQKDQVSQVFNFSNPGRTAKNIKPTVVERYDENMDEEGKK